MSIVGSNALAGASGQSAGAGPAPSGFQIDRSVRLNSADSAHFSRTPSSAGNRRTFTWSSWVKRSKLSTGTNHYLLSTANVAGNDYSSLYFDSSDDTLVFQGNNGSGSVQFNLKTSALFRDVSSWYHIVLSADSTQSTSSDRIKLYVNGQQIDSFGTEVYPSQNFEFRYNSTNEHGIGKAPNFTTYFDGYLAEVHFIDGQALAPTDFGEYDDNNVWQPIEYAGTYGTNGFHLDFSDNSSNAALGTDSSGNSNTWTVNNLTALGVAYSNDLTASGAGFALSSTAEDAFDGSLTSAAYGQSGGSLTWTPSPAIPYSTSVEVYPYQSPGDSASLNGGASVSLTSGQWNTIASGSGTITSLVVSDPSNKPSIAGIRVDGTILVDSSPANTDSLIDTPTNYTAASGNNGGNYCTLNPLDKNSSLTLSNGNLDFTGGATPNVGCRSTFFITSGKYYWEITNMSGGGNFTAGIAKSSWPLSYVGVSNSFAYASQGTFFPSNPGATATDANTAGDVVGVAFDADNGTLDIYVNGTSLNTASGWGTIPSDSWSPAFASGTSINQSVNFGQRPFAYPPGTSGGPSSDYKSLCTTNLPDPDPTIADGSTAFDVNVWDGDGTTNRLISTNFSPDFTWMKIISQSGQWHLLADSVRGGDKTLSTNNTNAEVTRSGFVSFDSTGFTIGDGNSNPSGGQTLVGFAWDAGSSTVTNTDGSITSSVRANPSAGFSIVSYTGNGSAGATVGTGLNASPDFVIIKVRNGTAGWFVWHSTEPNKYLAFGTGAAVSNTGILPVTNSTIGFKANYSIYNANTFNYVAYCFAPVEGYSAFGSYTGNGSTSGDGPFVYLGFRPKFIMFKRTDSTGGWYIRDAERDAYNEGVLHLKPHTSDAEENAGAFGKLDYLSNGFKWRNTAASPDINASGGTYIYAAFAEHPFKTARAR